MEKLSKKQEETLKAIKQFVAKNHYSPSVREICTIMNLKSTATVFVHMKHLMNKGYIKQTNNKFRTLEILVPNEYLDTTEEIIKVPLVGSIAAGNPIEAIEHPDEYLDLPSYMVPLKEEIFTLKVDGLSMKNIGILDGDIVVVKKANTAKNGEIVVALNEEGFATLKTFYKEKDHIRLQPENETMQPIILKNVNILGIAVGLYRKF